MLAAAAEMGHPPPLSIANAPELRQDLQFYLDAYFHLSTTRGIGMSVGPIPWTAVADYARTFDADVEELYDVITQVDAAYLKWVEANKPKDQLNDDGKGNQGNT